VIEVFDLQTGYTAARPAESLVIAEIFVKKL
jgi:hypothetical protein